MKPVLTRIPIEDFGTLQTLVTDNAEAIESGLTVIDSRLLLGHAAIDLVARDADGSFVLVALGFTADESLLLRIVEAYSWCLEYPESMRRHYPTLHLSEEQPPRVMFIIERVADSFQRKVKQLNLSSVDVIEFRYIDVDGNPAPYFETVAQLRRSGENHSRLTSVATPRRESARILSDVPAAHAARSNGHASERVRLVPVDPDPIIAAASNATLVAPRTVRTETPTVKTETPKPVEMPKPSPRIDEAPKVVEAPRVAAVRNVVEAPIELPRVVETPEVVHASRLLTSTATAAAAPVPEVPTVVSVAAPAALIVAEPEIVAQPEATTPVSAQVTTGAEHHVITSEAAVSNAPAAVETTAAVALAEEHPAAVEPAEAVNPKHLFAEAAKATQIAKEFGIQLPDGALTRQWIDFLNQLAGK
jgi:hypothetical protein